MPTDSTDIPSTWKAERLGALAVIGTGATPLRKRRDYYGGAIPWLKSACVNDDPVIQADEYITDLAIAETNAKLFPVGTLLMAMYGEGATRGKVTELGIGAATNQALAAIVLRTEHADLRPFLKLALRAEYEAHRELSAGGVQPNLSLTLVRDMVIPVPPPAERVEIVRRVGMLFRLADTIETGLSAAADCTGRLPAAILAKAFRGQRLST
jgi:type I restriction enzyme S subunit